MLPVVSTLQKPSTDYDMLQKWMLTCEYIEISKRGNSTQEVSQLTVLSYEGKGSKELHHDNMTHTIRP